MKKQAEYCATNREIVLRVTEHQNGIRSKVLTQNGVCRRVVCLQGREEFVLFVESGSQQNIIKSSDCLCSAEQNADELILNFKHALFDAGVCYQVGPKAVRKQITVKAKESLRILQATTELSDAGLPLTRGGEGQPVFIGDKMFAGIEFPAACNFFDHDQLLFSQSPFVLLKAGESFSFFSIVFGFAQGGKLEESFVEYICANRRKTGETRIYCDWGLHDELSDNISLTEEMTLSMLDKLAALKNDSRIEFDYYLMDAFWFEKNQPYIRFKNDTFPGGIEKVKSRISELGMKFGLWFDINLVKAEIDGYEQCRRKEDEPELCMADETAVALLREALEHHVRNNQVKMLKFDFAYFDCDNPSHTNHARGGTQSKEPAIRAFLQTISHLRQIDSDLVVLAYNGFTTDLSWIGSVTKERRGFAVSPWWAFYLDYIYCGDPRASEIAAPELRSSIEYYTDAMVYQFAQSLMPFEAIDDHGTIIGNTGTIYYLGKEGFRNSWVLNIARGGKKLHFYGDIHLLDDEDIRFMKESYLMYTLVADDFSRTRFLLGNPLDGEPYGYSNSLGTQGFVTLVNPCLSSRTVTVSLDEWAAFPAVEWNLFYQDGSFQKTSTGQKLRGSAEVCLKAGEVAVYRWELSPEPTPKKGGIYLEEGQSVHIRLGQTTRRFFLIFFDDRGLPLRTASGLPEGFQAIGHQVCLTAQLQKPVWSGISWAGFEVRKTGENPEVELCSHSSERIFVKWQETGEADE